MRRMDRLFELIGHLREGELVRAEDLARRMEVSVRTVYRDIAALQGQGYPIDGQAGLGYLLRGALDLPPLTFDHDEIEALTLGLAYVRQVGDGPLAAAARSAAVKIAEARGLGPSEDMDSAISRMRSVQRPERRAPDCAAALRSAMRRQKLVDFAYSDGEGRQSRRQVRPLALTAFSDGWLLVGWCLLRQDFRLFRLDRIGALSVLSTGFVDEPGRDLAGYRARPPGTAGNGPGPAGDPL